MQVNYYVSFSKPFLKIIIFLNFSRYLWGLKINIIIKIIGFLISYYTIIFFIT